MNYLFSRLAEPSTWAGLALLLSHTATAYATRNPADLAAVLAGMAAVLAPERRGD